MNESINVRRVQTLRNLKNSFNNFSDDIQGSLIAIEHELQRVLDSLKRNLEACERNVANTKEELQDAREALRDRESMDDDECYDDIDEYIERVEEARRKLVYAENERFKSRRWLAKIETAIQHFGIHAKRLKALATDRTDKAKAILDQAMVDLQKYLNLSTPIGSEIEILSNSNRPLERTISEPKRTTGRWVKNGVIDLGINEIPIPKDIVGSQDFKKVPIEEMRAGLERLKEMMPIIQSGVGAKKDYWVERDRQLGLDNFNGYVKIYDAFYGHDAIRVEKIDNKYDIINGRHRIWLAKQMGITNLPINLVEFK